MRPIFIALLCVAGCSLAQAAPITVIHQHTVYEVANDGTLTTDTDVALRIDETQAVTGMGQIPVQYSESLQTLQILEAYTTTKDGKRIDVPADKIITQQQPASSGAPSFSDYKVKNLVFPQVEVGATLNLHYRTTQLKPFLPGVVSALTVFNPFYDTQSGDIVLRAPEKMKLYISSRTVKGGEVKSAVREQREWHWTYGDARAMLPEPGSLIYETFAPYVAFSNLESFPQLAQAYMVGAVPAAKVTPAIQKLADEITSGITDRRLQAEALYRWVGTQIRYVAIAMGTGGYVPHLADEIVAARYGDCKDKTTLLTALLHAKGIRAMPVLIHTAAAYKVPDTVFLSAFNHAITYLPDWDLYVDSTPGVAPFGVLPSALQGKAVLLAGDDGMKPVMKTTPLVNAGGDRVVQRTRATLAADGTVSGTNRIEAVGSAEAALRGLFNSIPETLRPQLVKSLLASSGQNGEGTLTLSDVRNLAVPFSFVLDFKTPQSVNVPGPGALATAFGMPPLAGAQSFVTSMLQVDRKLDFPCPHDSTEEVLELALPAEVKITTLPKAASIESPYGKFATSYEAKDGKLLVDRRLDLVAEHAACTAADSAALRKFATDISQQLRAQVLYQ